MLLFLRGIGNPYSTDTTARYVREVEADVILMGKNNVDGVRDPKVDKNAVKYEHLTHIQMLQEGLQVMDSTASSFCMDNNIPLNVFSIMEEGNIKRAVMGEKIGTLITK